MIYKKIMVAVDGSDNSNNALLHAIELAKDQNATLYLLHVVEESFGFRGGVGYDYDSLINIYKEEGFKVLEESEKIVKSNSAVACKTLLVQLNTFQGRIAEVVIDKADELSVDLLVVGTHGRRGFNHLFLGSVAEQVMRIANNPVLLVRSTQTTAK